jgi:ribosomal protein S4
MSYTDKEIETITELYTGQDNAAELKVIAETLGKTEPSVRAKLSSMGLYIKSAQKTAKKKGVKKEDLTKQIAPMLKLNEIEEEALGKTTVAVLEKILARLTNGE